MKASPGRVPRAVTLTNQRLLRYWLDEALIRGANPNGYPWSLLYQSGTPHLAFLPGQVDTL